MKTKTIASVARFAHLLGFNAQSAVTVDDEDDDAPVQGADESDEDFAKRLEEYEDDKKSKKAEGDEKDDKADSDDTGEAGDTDDESDEKKAGRVAERARCAAIFGSKAAASRPDMAAHLAFETSMSASASINMLNAIASGQPKLSTVASRMATVEVPVVGADAMQSNKQSAQGSASATANLIISAGKKVRGEQA